MNLGGWTLTTICLPFPSLPMFAMHLDSLAPI